MNDIIIQTARKSDNKALEDFLAVNNGEESRPLAVKYINCMHSDDYRRPSFVIARQQNGKIIGAAAYSEELFTVNVWGISWVCVDAACQRKGIGQRLIEKCLADISQTANKTVTVILATYPGKTKLYERIGFIKSGVDHDGGSFMTLILNP